MYIQPSLKLLIRVYGTALKNTKLGIFLGAGTSIDSNIPNFKNFAFNAFHEAFTSDEKFGQHISSRLKDYIDQQAKAAEPELNPEELFSIIKKYFRTDLNHRSIEWKKAWLHFCARELYRHNEALEKGNWRIRKEAYGENITLRSIISFCMALSDDFADTAISGFLDSSKFRHNTAWNPRLGGVLTTNYDDLFEATINHKFSRTKGTEYGARSVFEGRRHKNQIHLLEVQHIHGFLTHDVEYYCKTDKKELIDIIATETDFFKTFYESMSFSNYAGLRFFDQFHTLFIGCKMDDKNIRRFLYHLSETKHFKTAKFAIMRCNCRHRHRGKKIDTFTRDCLDDGNIFTEELLKTYGVRVIWICNYNQVPTVLQKVYESTGGNWKRVYEEMW